MLSLLTLGWALHSGDINIPRDGNGLPCPATLMTDISHRMRFWFAHYIQRSYMDGIWDNAETKSTSRWAGRIRLPNREALEKGVGMDAQNEINY